MAGNLNALGLILVMVLTAAILARLRSRPRSIWQVIGGLATAVGVMFVVKCLTVVLYDEANNSHQVFVPSACLALLFIFTNPSRIRAVTVTAVTASMLVWSIQVFSLAGPSSRYTGNPRAARRTCRVIAYYESGQIRKLLSYEVKQDNRIYPAGWLAETKFGRNLSAHYPQYVKSPAADIRSFWHTPLTGLYAKSYYDLSAWYPGGRLKDGLVHLEFRPR